MAAVLWPGGLVLRPSGWVPPTTGGGPTGPTVTAIDLTAPTAGVTGGESVVLTLRDQAGKPLAGAQVAIAAGGVGSLSASTTNAQGQVTYTGILAGGSATIVATYNNGQATLTDSVALTVAPSNVTLDTRPYQYLRLEPGGEYVETLDLQSIKTAALLVAVDSTAPVQINRRHKLASADPWGEWEPHSGTTMLARHVQVRVRNPGASQAVVRDLNIRSVSAV